MKSIFIDVETTGTDSKKNGIIQLAGALFVGSTLKEQFNIKCQPFTGDVIEEEALAVTGMTREIIAQYQPALHGYRQFTDLMAKHIDKFDKKDKAHFIAYNADFDADMIRDWFVKAGDQYFGSWFWYPPLDVAKLAGIRLMARRHELQNFQLMTVAKHFNLVTDEQIAESAHDAMFDIKTTMRLFKVLAKDLALFDYQPTLNAQSEVVA